MSTVLIIGAGGVGGVVAHKCAQLADIFTDITLASRTVSKCDAIAASVRERTGVSIKTAAVDADNVPELSALIRKVKPALVINVSLPYQDLHIMDACLATGVNYLDTANYEPPEEAKFEYKWQWAYQDRFKEAGLTALLGCGFDPGVTNIFCAYAQKELFDEIHYVDILDCNAGSHGHPFATNFNPEINIREITQKGKYWENGEWKYIEPMSVSHEFDYPGVGPRMSYLLYHEEEESLVRNIKGLKRIRFWMTFGQEYLTHLRVLANVGMTGIEPVMYEGREIVPLKFLKALLPDPASLSTNYSGQTSIGCLIDGIKDGQRKVCFIYNNCDHAECHKEVGAQAVSYTTGVPAMIGAKMLVKGLWQGKGVFNVEEFDPQPFMAELNLRGLPWHINWLDKKPEAFA